LLAKMNTAANHQRGLTLIELLVVLAILAVLAAVAAPSMVEFIARQRVEGTANELMADMRMARSAALQANQATTFVFNTTGTTRCYTLAIDLGVVPICDCSRAPGPSCTAIAGPPPKELKTVNLSSDLGVTMKASALRLEFNGASAMPSLGAFAVEINSDGGGRMKVVTNGAGRPLLCNVSGHSAFPPCP
jgi:type IV fimbrial biogenesis protein FimT